MLTRFYPLLAALLGLLLASVLTPATAQSTMQHMMPGTAPRIELGVGPNNTQLAIHMDSAGYVLVNDSGTDSGSGAASSWAASSTNLMLGILPDGKFGPIHLDSSNKLLVDCATCTGGSGGSFTYPAAGLVISNGSAFSTATIGSGLTLSGGTLSASGGGGGGGSSAAAGAHPGVQTGQSYYFPSTTITAANGSTTNTYGNITYTPFYLANAATLQSLSIQLGGTVWDGTVIRFGIYSNSNGMPGTLLWDSGQVSLSSADANSIYTTPTINLSLSAQWIWIASGVNTGISVSTYEQAAGYGFYGFSALAGLTGTANPADAFNTSLLGYVSSDQVQNALPNTPTNPVPNSQHNPMWVVLNF